VPNRISTPKLILASVSPRRRELLAKLGYPFEVQSSGVEEHAQAGKTPPETAVALAGKKAETVAESLDRGVVLAADTVIDMNGTLLGKPEDTGAAFHMLRLLAGRMHRVVTGMALVDAKDGRKVSVGVETEVTMLDYETLEIEEYVQTGEPLDKAGAYAIQGRGSSLVAAIEGCYNNVVGLPLCEVVTRLKEFGIRLGTDATVCQSPSGDVCPRTRKLGYRSRFWNRTARTIKEW
jgi:septum formation protein